MFYICCNFFDKNFLKRTTSLKYLNLSIKSWSIVFFGSDYYSLSCLTALHNEVKQQRISRMDVVVVNDRTPVYNYSVSNGFKIHMWPPNLNGSYDFGVVVSFGKLIPKSIIDLFPLGIINVHPSLLPKYRGGMPIVHTLKNGESSTGVTIARIKADKFDIGEILLQKPCSIDKNELMPSLYKRLSDLGCDCLLEVVRDMPKCLDKSFPQSDNGVSYAPRLKKEDAVVRWNEMTALEVFNLHRALFGIFELSSTWKGSPIKFVCMLLSDSDPYCTKFVATEDTKLEPGNFTYSKKTKFLYVQCKDKPITVCTLKYKKNLYKASSFQTGYLKDLERTFWKFNS